MDIDRMKVDYRDWPLLCKTVVYQQLRTAADFLVDYAWEVGNLPPMIQLSNSI